MKFGTKLIHAGIRPDPSTGAVMTPIYQTSTYVQEAPGVHKGFEYGRTQNPTRSVLEENLASLESGNYAMIYASGLAAMDVILKTLNPGDEIISSSDLYGGSYRLMVQVFGKYGIQSHFVDLTDDNWTNLINEKTKLIWIESPTNPMLSLVDITKVAEIAKKNNITTCVDNTFATPYLQRPLELGIDIVTHSVTKYLAGHSDVIQGAIITNDEKLAEEFRFLQNAAGAVPGPMDCFLTLRGLKTLHLRMERACHNAKSIAQFLQAHPKVSKVYYPGFESHPGHEIAVAQMDDFGAMVSFDLVKDDFQVSEIILKNTKYFLLAESLGGVESLIGHPASMTHASIPKEERLKVGLTDSLIRLSMGVEDVDDLISDLEAALSLI